MKPKIWHWYLVLTIAVAGAYFFAARQDYSAEYRTETQARKIACPPTMAPVDCLRANKPAKRTKASKNRNYVAR